MVVNWIQSFLNNRKQSVVIGEFVSDWKPATSEVSQGSVLGLFIFFIYINDLPEACSSICKLYADDTKILIPLTIQWKMSFRKEKCVVMHFRADNPRHNYTIIGHNFPIQLKNAILVSSLQVILNPASNQKVQPQKQS